jgi:hypothetical protein
LFSRGVYPYGKGDLEKLFFGDFSARVEFFYMPYHEEASAFRIVKQGSSHILEVKYVSNFKEVRKMFEDKSVSNFDEEVKLYEVETRSVPVSNYFVEELYQKIASFIVNFEATEVEKPDIVPVFSVGHSVIFRSVIKKELWSLWISPPQGDALKLDKLCREIINDIRANKFSESIYIYAMSDI